MNEELEILAAAVESALDCLHVDGRIVVESYHSGEDRLVKTAFTRRTRSSAPPGLPVELEEHKPTFSPSCAAPSRPTTPSATPTPAQPPSGCVH